MRLGERSVITTIGDDDDRGGGSGAGCGGRYNVIREVLT